MRIVWEVFRDVTRSEYALIVGGVALVLMMAAKGDLNRRAPPLAAKAWCCDSGQPGAALRIPSPRA